MGFTLKLSHSVICPDDNVSFEFAPDEPVTNVKIYVDMDRTTYPSGAVTAQMTFNGTSWVLNFIARESAPCEQNPACPPGATAPDSTIDDYSIDVFVTISGTTTKWAVRIR